MLEIGVSSLDITETERRLAVSRYTGLGRAFGEHWEDTRGDDVVMPQGSFLLGTVVRNVLRNDDIDIDLVAIRDVDKTSTTQSALKQDAGQAVRRYAQTPSSGHPRRTECSRCWTLTWPAMHLDVLPAVPDRSRPGAGILITDSEVQRWLPSDPRGFSHWFRSRMQDQLHEQRRILAKRLEVDAVPDWRVKTTLQQSVQALKRHRDIFFKDRPDRRPTSIIITTLAALSYDGGNDLYEVLRSVTARMSEHLVYRDGWVLPNPARPEENFADGWAHDQRRADDFFRWLESAQVEFDGFGKSSGLEHGLPLLEASFGDKFARAAADGLGLQVHRAGQTGALRSADAGLMISSTGSAGASTTGRSVKPHGFAGGSPL